MCGFVCGDYVWCKLSLHCMVIRWLSLGMVRKHLLRTTQRHFLGNVFGWHTQACDTISKIRGHFLAHLSHTLKVSYNVIIGCWSSISPSIRHSSSISFKPLSRISPNSLGRDQARGRLGRNSRPRGRNFALNGTQGEVGVSVKKKKKKKKNFFFFFFFF